MQLDFLKILKTTLELGKKRGMWIEFRKNQGNYVFLKQDLIYCDS